MSQVPFFLGQTNATTEARPEEDEYEGEEEEVSEENEEGGDSEEYKEIQVRYAFGIL